MWPCIVAFKVRKRHTASRKRHARQLPNAKETSTSQPNVNTVAEAGISEISNINGPIWGGNRFLSYRNDLCITDNYFYTTEDFGNTNNHFPQPIPHLGHHFPQYTESASDTRFSASDTRPKKHLVARKIAKAHQELFESTPTHCQNCRSAPNHVHQQQKFCLGEMRACDAKRNCDNSIFS